MNRRDFVRAIPGAALAVPLVAREAWAGPRIERVGPKPSADTGGPMSLNYLLELDPPTVADLWCRPAVSFEVRRPKSGDFSWQHWQRAHDVTLRGPTTQYIRMLREHGYEFLVMVTPEQEAHVRAHAGWFRSYQSRPFEPFRWAGFVDTERGRCLHIILKRCDASDREWAARDG